MNYIGRFLCQLSIVSLIILLSGCSREPKLWLYNFSGSSVTAFYPGQQVLIGSEKGSLLEGWGTKKNTLEPYNLKMEFDEGFFCYILHRITVGGYGEYAKSNKLAFRFRLGQNKNISVYKVGGEFNSHNSVGLQPKGYPALPEECPNSEQLTQLTGQAPPKYRV